MTADCRDRDTFPHSPGKIHIDVPTPGGTTPFVFKAPGSPASRAAWVSHTDQSAVDRSYLFVHSFLRDYPPIGTWIAEQGGRAPELQALFNTWCYSGLQDVSGAWKPEMLAIGLPEPSPGVAIAWGGALAGATQENLQFRWQSPKRRATQRSLGR